MRILTSSFRLLLILSLLTTLSVAHAQHSCQAAYDYVVEGDSATVAFTDLSTSEYTITSWLWNFGNGQTSTLQNPTYTYVHDGTYQVCLKIHDDHGCLNVTCQTIVIMTGVQLDCEAEFESVQEDSSLVVSFTDLSTSSNPITSWLWIFGDGQTSTLQNPSHSYNHPGTYEVCLKVHDSHGCLDITCMHITVLHANGGDCWAGFEYQQIPNSQSIAFSDASQSSAEIISWYWDFGDGNTSDEENPTHNYLQIGTYQVCLTIADGNECTAVFCHDVKVKHPDPSDCQALYEFQLDPATQDVQFTDLSTSPDSIVSWLWTFGDGTSSTEQNPVHTFHHAGTYQVCLKIHDSQGCVSIKCKHIAIQGGGGDCKASFSFQAGNNSGNGIQFTNTSTGTTNFTTYLWEFGDGTTSSEENPYHVFENTGHFAVCLFIADDSTGCESHKCVVVHIHHIGMGHGDGHMEPQEKAMASSADQFGNDAGVISFPNPFSEFTTVSYSLEEDTRVRIELIDFNGQQLRTVTDGVEPKGNHSHLLYADRLVPGFYFIRWTAGNETQIQMVTVVR